MNVREGARRIRVIAMCLIALGIVAVAVNIVAMQMSQSSVGVVDWVLFVAPGIALALLAWVVDGFGQSEEKRSQEKLGETEVKRV